MSRFRDAFDGIESLEDRLSMSTVLWTGAGDGHTLNSRYNWQCNHLPTSCDTAIVDLPGDHALTMSSGSFVPYKLIFAEQLTVTGGTMNIGSGGTSLSGTMHMAGGTYDGCGLLSDSGLLDWTAGLITGMGNIDVTASGTLNFNGSNPLDLRRDITNRGRINWLNGNIDGNDAGGTSIVNKPGALFKAVGNGRFRSLTGTGLLDNQGLFVRDEAGASQVLVPFRNSGTLNVAGGTLQLWAGGANSGQRNVAQDATLHYFGDFTEDAGSTLAGGGATIWQGGTHTITADWSMASYLYISNATVTGPGTWTIDGVLGWSHGTLSGPGGTVIGPTGKIEIRTLGPHTLARDILNNGTLIWNRGPLTMAGATITNPAGQAFYVAADAVAVNGGGVNRIVNHGELRKVLPTAADFGDITLDNDGLVNVHNGSLTLNQGAVAQIAGTTLTGGSWSVYAVGSISFGGADIQTVGAGALIERIGPTAGFGGALAHLTRNEGTIRVIGGGSLDLTPIGGAFTNAGSLILRNMTALTVDGNFVQEDIGSLTIGLPGPVSLASGRVLVVQDASLAGSVSFDLELGYQPQPGDEFLFLGALSAEGHFSGLQPSAGPTAELIYQSNGVLLRFV